MAIGLDWHTKNKDIKSKSDIMDKNEKDILAESCARLLETLKYLDINFDELYNQAMDRLEDFSEKYDEEMVFCTMQKNINYEITDRYYEEMRGPNSNNEYSNKQKEMGLSWDDWNSWNELSTTNTNIIFKPNKNINIDYPIAFFEMTGGDYGALEVDNVKENFNCKVINNDDYWFVYSLDPTKESIVDVSVSRCCED